MNSAMALSFSMSLKCH